MNFFYILGIPLLIFFINKFINSKNLLQSLSGEKHQLFVEKKKIPLSGGIIMVFFLFLITKFNVQPYYLFFLFIFFIGFFSDLNLIKSARFRFFLQVLSIFLFVIFYDFQISNIKIIYIDLFLENKIFSYFFVIFCILIIVNGSNFIDGLNGLAIGYFLIVLLILYNLELIANLNISKIQVEYFLILLFFLLLFNFFNKLYIGDGGSYFLGFIFGVLLILVYKLNSNISPFFIVLILWYPCFENLFSIIRKHRFNLSPLKSDNKHFHQLLFYFIKKKLKLSNLVANNLSSILINLFNFISLSFAAKVIYITQLQIIIIFFNIIIYIIVYLKLFNFRFKKE